jgi:hypothetical protein
MSDDPATRDSVQPLTTTVNVTQVALEQWATPAPSNAQVTQVGAEQWGPVIPPQLWVTQVGVEEWRTVAYILPAAGQMDGHADVNARGSIIKFAAGQMNGVASMAAVGSRRFVGVAQMDGHADVLGDTLAVTHAAARLDGFASMAAGGGTVVNGAAQMDGTSSFIAITEAGAAMGQMDGWADMVAISYTPPVIPMTDRLQDGVVFAHQPRPAARMTYHLYLAHNMRLTPTQRIVFRMRVVLRDAGLTMSAALRWKWVMRAKDSFSFHLSSATHTNYHYELITPIRVRPTLAPAWNALLSLIESFHLSQALSPKFIWGRAIKEIIKVSPIVIAGGVYHRALAQLFKLSEAFQVRRALTLSEHITLSSSSFMAYSLKLLQKALVASAASPTLNYHLSLVGRIVLDDIIGHYHFAAMLLADMVTVHDAVSRQYFAVGNMAELIALSPKLTNTLTLQLVGNIQVSSEQLLQLLYQGDELLDGVIINALYISPSGTTTTWAVNTRTNAVTEYMNYDFRSFTKMGDRYIAADEDGLYELDGDTDDGASIIAELMSGYLQLNDKKLFGIKGAYVAIRGGGRFYLKLVSGDGREYVYELRAQPNLMTTKVRIGKGISTTYIAFDLITEGQDFDLDSIEFVPMTRGRRV